VQCMINGVNSCDDTTTDANNCGSCGMVCGMPEAGGPPTCANSMCAQ
jgi:hypothetical protein